MTKKPILTKEQIQAKCEELNNIPEKDRLPGMKLSLNCAHVRGIVSFAWDQSKKNAEAAGVTDICDIFNGFLMSVAICVVHSIGAPELVVEHLSNMLAMSHDFNGMVWHVLSEVAPEEDIVLLTGNFDVYSEVSNG